MEDLPNTETEGALLGLPETQTELDNLTEFNTAHNRRISMLGISTEDGTEPKKQKRNVSFNEEVDIINPEDIDPSIGRFRNLVKSTIVPNANTQSKKLKLQSADETPEESTSNEPRRKKYAKEAWPGRKPGLLPGV
ncbi:Nuclear inhibitor of protein phosphatase 1 [Operophtera brumata]|uniref:Nuclear inhibitor of protein phosphatase 1 n=1 Tax=Operophtera brumata TaxID=104452 RepID=A0A0L7KTQ9_OPEBR|nr:Nuclear inhibitor of protein phosphatase 1 [Operophtera brumata]